MSTLGNLLLGRTAPKTTRHLELYPSSLTAPAYGSLEVDIKRPTLSDYNQGQTPECVAYSLSKIMNHYNGESFDAPWLYAECKKIDGDPTGDGTNATAACDVLRREGHWRTIKGKDVKAGPLKKHGIAGNTWATSVDAIRAAFAGPKPQPVALGIPWFEAWFTPRLVNGEHYLEADLHKAGPLEGGHEIGAWACSDKRHAVGLSNTWGSEYPDIVWLAYSTITTLLTMGADACIVQDLATQ